MNTATTAASGADSTAHQFVLTDTAQGVEVAHWSISNETLGIETDSPFSIRKTTLRGGRQEGSTLITVDAGGLQLVVIPTRGMGLYRARCDDVVLGWNSPVDEIVHPAFMRLDGRGGLGWLDGFNEMMARCGFEWSGHPGLEDGRQLSLHGRAQNIPASRVVVSIERSAPYRITIKGLLQEKTFKFSNLEIWAGVSLTPGERTFHVHDTLRNLSDYEREYQIIYHSNFGHPLLESGSSLLAAAQEVSPFNDYAAQGLSGWQSCLPPTRGFGEMVFTIKPLADAAGNSLAMLSNAARSRGVALGFNVQQLPALTLWKNTDSEGEGYVVGIEPGTGFPYPRQIERAQGRIPKIGAGETKRFDIEYRILGSDGEVQQTVADIAAIQDGRETVLNARPVAEQ